MAPSQTTEHATEDKEPLPTASELQKQLRVDATMGANGFAKSLLRAVVVRSVELGGGSAHGRRDRDRLVVSFRVTPELSNGHGLHGGAFATATDVFTSVILHLRTPVPSVTSDLHVSCLAPAPIGSTVVCICTVDRAGGRLQYSSCDLYREESNNGGIVGESTNPKWIPIGKGLHTKCVLKKVRKNALPPRTSRL